MSAPPGIEFIFYMFLAGCILLASAIAYLIARLFRKFLKVTMRPIEIIIIAAIFLMSFAASSFVLQQRENGVTIYLYGGLTPYQGDFLYYGFPSIWYRRFEPYDPSFRHLFAMPSITNLGSFFVDATFWLAISVILVGFAKYLLTKHKREMT